MERPRWLLALSVASGAGPSMTSPSTPKAPGSFSDALNCLPPGGNCML